MLRQIVPDDNELTMHFMFMLAGLHGHGLEITDMQCLNNGVRQLVPFNELRGLFGQSQEPLYHLRIADRARELRKGEVAVFSGTQQACIDYAKSTVMHLLDAMGHRFVQMKGQHPSWQSQYYILYVVPKNFKL